MTTILEETDKSLCTDPYLLVSFSTHNLQYTVTGISGFDAAQSKALSTYQYDPSSKLFRFVKVLNNWTPKEVEDPPAWGEVWKRKPTPTYALSVQYPADDVLILNGEVGAPLANLVIYSIRSTGRITSVSTDTFLNYYQRKS